MYLRSFGLKDRGRDQRRTHQALQTGSPLSPSPNAAISPCVSLFTHSHTGCLNALNTCSEIMRSDEKSNGIFGLPIILSCSSKAAYTFFRVLLGVCRGSAASFLSVRFTWSVISTSINPKRQQLSQADCQHCWHFWRHWCPPPCPSWRAATTEPSPGIGVHGGS